MSKLAYDYQKCAELCILLKEEINILRKQLSEKDILIKEQQEQIDILEAKIFKK